MCVRLPLFVSITVPSSITINHVWLSLRSLKVVMSHHCQVLPEFIVCFTALFRWQPVQGERPADQQESQSAAEIPVWWAEGAPGSVRPPGSDGAHGAASKWVCSYLSPNESVSRYHFTPTIAVHLSLSFSLNCPRLKTLKWKMIFVCCFWKSLLKCN